jgi:hypothetical protein
VNNAWTRTLTLGLSLISVRGRLHVRQHCLAEMEGCGQVRLNVRLPLLAGVGVVHGGSILPVGTGDATIVDQDIDAVGEEGRCFLGGTANFWDAAEVADGVTEVAVFEEMVEMDFGGVPQFFFVEV